MSLRWLLATALLLCANPTTACINSPGTDHQGNRFVVSGETGQDLVDYIATSDAPEWWRSRAEEIILAARDDPSVDTLTDLGIVLVYQGQYTRAIELFVSIERTYPGLAGTAANLGTALELAGYDAVALRWIRIGIQRNADEHDGTEWLHARILEAKIAAAHDPTWLRQHSVAGLDFEQALVPQMPRVLPTGNTGKPVSGWELATAFEYQLHERIGFVKPRDPVVANLLLDYATLNLAGGPIETAGAAYELAVTYGAPRDALLRNRQDYIRRVLAQPTTERGSGWPCAICYDRDAN